MAGTLRTRSALDTLFADNTAGDISAQDLRDFLWSAPMLLGRVNAALTAGNLTATVNYHHVLDVSGMTADRDLVIPAGSAEGDTISFSLETDAASGFELRLIGDTGVTLNLLGTDRTATADNSFLYFIKGEGARLRWDATDSKWLLTKADDGRIAAKARLEAAATQTLASASVWEGADFNTGEDSYDVGALFDPTIDTNVGGFNIRRDGKYIVQIYSQGVVDDAELFGISLKVNGTQVPSLERTNVYSPTASATQRLGQTHQKSFSSGDTVSMMLLNTNAGNLDMQPIFAISEVL